MPQSTPRPWTPQEDSYIREHYLAQSARQMAQALNRPLSGVYQRKHVLGYVTDQRKREIRSCAQCGESFETIPCSPKKYCSLRCAYASKDRIVERPKERGTRTCPQCGKVWKVTTAKSRDAHCSHHCALIARRKFEDRVCVQCGALFPVRTKSFRKCCSTACTGARKSANSRALMASEQRRQELSDRTARRHAEAPPGSPGYSNRKDGRREDLGGQYFRSAWEANYARYLNWLVAQGQIKSWRYEPVTFWFEKIKRGVRSYKPDFEVVNLDDSIEYHEVKGYDHPRGVTARKRMAIYHPEVKLVLVDEEQYKAIRKWKALMPEWEGR